MRGTHSLLPQFRAIITRTANGVYTTNIIYVGFTPSPVAIWVRDKLVHEG
jgi:hypothetical protein